MADGENHNQNQARNSKTTLESKNNSPVPAQRKALLPKGKNGHIDTELHYYEHGVMVSRIEDVRTMEGAVESPMNRSIKKRHSKDSYITGGAQARSNKIQVNVISQFTNFAPMERL